MDARAGDAATGAAAAIATVERLCAAINARDVEAVLALLADECLLTHTLASRGAAVRGRSALRVFWATALHPPSPRVELEDLAASEGRCAVRWRIAALAADGFTRELRGTATVLVRDGLVTLIEAGPGE
jgi:ketosteroid isomerase-like protein